MKKMMVGTIAIVAGTQLVPGTAGTARADQFTLMRAAKHADVVFVTDPEYQAAFSNARYALQVDEGVGDVACVDPWLGLYDIWWYSGGGSDDNVDSEAEFNASVNNAANGYLVVVDSITWCGVPGSYGGCATVGTEEGFLVTRSLLLGAAGGTGLLHEFGHSVGLNHDSSNSRYIMYPSAAANHTFGRTAWCDNFDYFWYGDCTTGICSYNDFGMAAESEIAARRPRTDSLASSELSQVVILDQMPVELEDIYDDRDVDELVPMLSSPEHKDRHHALATLIGLVTSGTDYHVNALQEYLASSGEDDRGVAAMALAFVVARTGREDALSVLLAAEASDDKGLSEAAVLALGVTGSTEGLGRLETASKAGRHSPDRLQIAREANREIARLGLRDYYLSARPASTSGAAQPGGQAGPDEGP